MDNNDDEFGMMLWWGGVDADLSITSLRQKRCAVCGAPATAAVRRLDQQERRFVCDTHRKADGAP